MPRAGTNIPWSLDRASHAAFPPAHKLGKLRIPREVELAGLDYDIMEAAKDDEKTVASSS